MVARYNLIIIVAILCFVIGCGQREVDLIPRQRLSPAEENNIRQAIGEVNFAKLKQIGNKAVPMIIERIFEIYNSKPHRQDPVWCDACNLILLLGKIGDERAVPALEYLLVEKRYRTFRGEAAHSLAMIGDKSAVGSLWRVFKEEKGYLKQGDRRGPDMGWGLAGNYTSLVLEEIGLALQKLGEEVEDFPRPFYGSRPWWE